MDPEVAAVAEAVRTWRVQESEYAHKIHLRFKAMVLIVSQVAFFTLVLWYYLTTIKEEVKYIWPQPTFKLGKILYYTTRICFCLNVLGAFLIEYPSHLHMSVEACKTISILKATVSKLLLMAAEAIVWTCLYALLQAKAAYYFPLIFIFAASHITSATLYGLAWPLRGYNAVPQSEMDAALGYPCTWDWVVASPGSALYPLSDLSTAGRYVQIGTLALTAICAFIVMVRYYRKQSGGLIRVLRVEGGLHYLAAITCYTVTAIASTPVIKNKDPYAIAITAQHVSLIFTDRLLLHLRKTQDPGTQQFVSTIVFNKDDEGSTVDFEDEESGNGPEEFDLKTTSDIGVTDATNSTYLTHPSSEVDPRPNEVVAEEHRFRRSGAGMYGGVGARRDEEKTFV